MVALDATGKSGVRLMGAITVPLSVADVNKAAVQPVANGIVPCDQALAISLPLLFTPTSQALMIDLTESARKFGDIPIQGAYIDLAQSAITMSLIVPATGQAVIARSYTQGYYALLVPMPARLMAVLASAPAGNLPVTVIVFNTPIGGSVWTTQ